MVPTPAPLAGIRFSFAVCAAAGGASAMEAASAILAPDATRPQQPAQPKIGPPHATPSRTTFPLRSVIPLCLLTRAARKSGSHFRRCSRQSSVRIDRNCGARDGESFGGTAFFTKNLDLVFSRNTRKL